MDLTWGYWSCKHGGSDLSHHQFNGREDLGGVVDGIEVDSRKRKGRKSMSLLSRLMRSYCCGIGPGVSLIGVEY